MRNGRKALSGLVAALVAGAGLAGLLAGEPVAQAAPVMNLATSAASDTLILRSGQIIEGTFVSETDTHVVFRVKVGGIEADATYAKSDVLKVERGVPRETPVEAKVTATRPASTDPGADRKKVYVLELKGWFGTDISQTPIREALRDARRHNPDYLIVVLENDWSLYEGLMQLTDDQVIQLGDVIRAEEMAPIFTHEVPREWDTPPQIIWWVKNAMGAAAFLPLSNPTIYFHSRAKMGGMGFLDVYFGSTGHERVRQKMYSAWGASARAMAIQGGYNPKIVKAMMLLEYELSYSLDGDTPVFHERMAEPGEFLLTDNAFKEENRDTVRDRVTGEGNDVLTLKADVAEKLQVSKGTVDTLEDLLYRLGIGRNHELIRGRGDAILAQWRQGVAMYGRDLRRMWQEFGEIDVQPPGEYRERTQARGRQLRKLDDIIRLIVKFEECLDPTQEGVPDKYTLELIKRRIELEQMQDRR